MKTSFFTMLLFVSCVAYGQNYAAFSETSVNFRKTASMSSEIITRLPKGAELYLIDTHSVNSFYHAIYVNTAQIGWVAKQYVKTVQLKSTAKQLEFTDERTSEDSMENADLNFCDFSDEPFYVGVYDSVFSVITVLPEKCNDIPVRPGWHPFIIFAPGVTPHYGGGDFKGGRKYSTGFKIVPRAAILGIGIPIKR